MSVLSASLFVRWPSSWSNRPILSLVLLLLLAYFKKLFILPPRVLAKPHSHTSPDSAPGELSKPHICIAEQSLYFPWLTRSCFHLLYASFLCLSFVWRSLLIHAGLLPLLLGFLHMAMDCSWLWRRWPWKSIVYIYDHSVTVWLFFSPL